MNKDFIVYLMERPHHYILVWSFLYAQTNEDGVCTYDYQLLLSKFQISRTTLQRIVEYGCEFTQVDGQKVGRKWAHKTLTINFINGISGQKVGRKWAENSETPSIKKNQKSKSKESTALYTQMIKIYDTFHQEQCSMGAKVNAIQGKNMKEIIAYLKTQVQKKKAYATEEELNQETIYAWDFILKNWSSLSDFHAKQIKLNQINSNLPNILTEIKKSKSKLRNERYASTSNQVDGISFG